MGHGVTAGCGERKGGATSGRRPISIRRTASTSDDRRRVVLPRATRLVVSATAANSTAVVRLQRYDGRNSSSGTGSSRIGAAGSTANAAGHHGPAGGATDARRRRSSYGILKQTLRSSSLAPTRFTGQIALKVAFPTSGHKTNDARRTMSQAVRAKRRLPRARSTTVYSLEMRLAG